MGDEFYDLGGPTFAQQGDIFAGVPLINPPRGSELVILRRPDMFLPPETLESGDLRAVRESSLNAFDGFSEYVAVSASRAVAVLVTQTCDLNDKEYWLFSPFKSLDGSGIDEGNLFSGRFATLFGLPAHPNGEFEKAFIDLADLRLVHRDAVPPLSERMTSLSLQVRSALSEKLAQTMGRRWGYAPGEVVPTNATYRCEQCNRYEGQGSSDHQLAAGTRFPVCESCRKYRKTAMWYPLLPRRR